MKDAQYDQQLERLMTEYLDTKSLHEKVTKRLDEVKGALTEIVTHDGVADDKGNLWLPVGTRQLKKERRVSRSFDLDAAAEWCKEQGIFDEVKTVVVIETVDEDKLLAYAWEHREASSVIESFNKERVSWAFKVVDKQAFIDES